MSIESRLTALQTKVEEILTVLSKNGNGNGNGRRTLFNQDDEDPWSMNTAALALGAARDDSGAAGAGGSFSFPVLLSPQAEIRTLELWRSVVSECLGTLCFVFFVCGVSIPWTGHFPPFLSIAFATALAYGALTFRVFPRAHLNPAFTIALTAIKRVTPLRCLLFLTAQAGGAIAGAAILYGLTVAGYQGTLGATTIASHISQSQAFGLELILSFIMTLTFVSDPTNCIPTTAVLLAANLVALPCTGAGLNPVRSLGPAFVMNKWPSHWVFWLGPIVGALLAAYLHCYLLRRGPKNKKMRDTPSDGDSMDLPTTDIPTSTIPDRLLCDRFEPLYGGTRSLYVKPSPILPRTNLNRSQSVYASKRFEFPAKFLDTSAPSSVTARKSTNTNHQSHCQRHFESDSNYEPLYDRKPPTGGGGGGNAQSLLISGPPSYESSYFKTYDKSNHSSSSHHHSNHHHGHHHSNSSSSNHGGHHREKSDSIVERHIQQRERERENQTNRILAQYETSKGLVDVDPKAALKSQLSKSLYYESNEHNLTSPKQQQQLQQHKAHLDCLEKKLLDTNENESSNLLPGNPPPPPRFRLPLGNPQQPLSSNGNTNNSNSQQQQQQRYPPSGQSHPSQTPPLPGGGFCPVSNDLSRGGSCGKAGVLGSGSNEPKKPYELLDSKKLLEFNGNSGSGNTNYSPRILMAERERDLTYSRILEPILNSKPSVHPQQQQQQQQANHNHTNGHHCHMSPNDRLTYSYH